MLKVIGIGNNLGRMTPALRGEEKKLWGGRRTGRKKSVKGKDESGKEKAEKQIGKWECKERK